MRTTTDKNGAEIRVGMEIRVIKVPSLPEQMRADSLPVFEKALGEAFTVHEIDQHGHCWVEVDGSYPGEHSIALEPACIEIA